MSILQMSISAGILVMAIVIIRAVALNRLPKTMFLFLWGVSLCRLLVPVSIPSRFSVYSIIGEVFKPLSHKTTVLQVVENILPMGSPVMEVTKQVNPTVQKQVYSIAPATIIWFAGMVAMFIFLVVVYFKNYRELRFALPILDNSFLDKWLTEHKLLRPIRIMQSDRIATPVAVGMIRPRIILPKSLDMDNKQLLQYVLTHEYYHIRRFDILWKMLLAIALCIHWFNPMMWVMFLLVNRDLEITCDEMVIRHFGIEAKTAYAYSLISMAEQRSRFVSLYSGFSRNTTEERIKSIIKCKKTTVGATLITATLIVSLTTAFATTAVGTTNMQDNGLSAENKSLSKTRKNTSSAIFDETIFANQIITYIANNDMNGLASLIKYPFTTKVDGIRMEIKTPEEFVQRYPQIMNEDTRLDILETDVATLFSNQYGYMLGTGKVWFSNFEKTGLLIYAINSVS